MEIDLDNAGAALQSAREGTLSLPLLQLITDARNEHGMRQLDYTRYRHFCTTKVHRLRQSLKVTHNDGVSKPSESKSKRRGGAKAKGKRKATGQAQLPPNQFTHKTIKASEIVNNRPAQLLLFEAERAWAHSQDLRDQSFKADQDPSLRRQGLTRASRAVEWTTKLRDLSVSLAESLDAVSALQVILYSLLIRGSASFDKNAFEPALESLSVARALLGLLANHATSSRDEALANSFIDGSDAQLRYCAYQLGVSEQDMDKVASQTATEEVRQRWAPGYEKLVERLAKDADAKGSRKGSKDKVELDWRGRKIPIRNADLMDAVIRVRTEEAALNSQLASADVKAGEAPSAPQKKERVKPQRLTHAERNAKKRGSAVQAPAAVKATARAGGSARASLDPYDRVLAALTDAEELASSLVDDDAEALAKAHSGRFAAATADLRAAHEWLAFRLHALRVRRNERLVKLVRRKGERREARAKEALERRLREAAKGRPPPVAGSGKAKKGADGQPIVKKEPKKPQPGARAKRSRTAPKGHTQRPARSGTVALRRKEAAERAQRQRSLAVDKVARRSVRAVPGLARLLDGAEASVSALTALGLVEADPDVQSLLDAKTAWYRAEVCIVLSRAYGLSGVLTRETASEKSASARISRAVSTAKSGKAEAGADAAARRIPPLAHAVVLLDRAALYVRQARQALELAEGVDEVDEELPPHLVTSSSTSDSLAETDTKIRTAKRDTQRQLARSHALARRSDLRVAPDDDGLPPNSKLANALRDLANKYVDWDTRVLEAAQRVVEDDLGPQADNDGTAEEAEGEGEDVFDDAPSPEAADPDADTEEAEQFYDDEEEGDDGQAAQTQEEGKKGWLGGWFGRS